MMAGSPVLSSSQPWSPPKETGPITSKTICSAAFKPWSVNHGWKYFGITSAEEVEKCVVDQTEVEKCVVEQTFNTRKQVLVNTRQEEWSDKVVDKGSATSTALQFNLAWHVVSSSTGQGPAAAQPPVLELPDSLQNFVESIIPAALRPRETMEAIVEEAIVEEAIVCDAALLDAQLAARPPNMGLLGEELATRWLTSQLWVQSVRWLNEVSDPCKDHDIECQLKAEPSPAGRRVRSKQHAEDKNKLHREVAWITWLLFVVYMTYIANMHIYIFG